MNNLILICFKVEWRYTDCVYENLVIRTDSDGSTSKVRLILNCNQILESLWNHMTLAKKEFIIITWLYITCSIWVWHYKDVWLTNLD